MPKRERERSFFPNKPWRWSANFSPTPHTPNRETTQSHNCSEERDLLLLWIWKDLLLFLLATKFSSSSKPHPTPSPEGEKEENSPPSCVVVSRGQKVPNTSRLKWSGEEGPRKITSEEGSPSPPPPFQRHGGRKSASWHFGFPKKHARKYL